MLQRERFGVRGEVIFVDRGHGRFGKFDSYTDTERIYPLLRIGSLTDVLDGKWQVGIIRVFERRETIYAAERSNIVRAMVLVHA